VYQSIYLGQFLRIEAGPLGQAVAQS